MEAIARLGEAGIPTGVLIAPTIPGLSDHPKQVAAVETACRDAGAGSRHRVPRARLWTVPIVGFGLLWWSLPLIREGPWRVGTGDSGNRILAHILPVLVAFLVLAAVEATSSEGGVSEAQQVS